jgi:hypothetical protein
MKLFDKNKKHEKDPKVVEKPQDVKSTDELSLEQMDSVSGGTADRTAPTRHK